MSEFYWSHPILYPSLSEISYYDFLSQAEHPIRLSNGWTGFVYGLARAFPDVYTGSFYTAWQVMIPTLPNQLGGSWGSCSQHGPARITLRADAVRATSELRVTFVCSQDFSVRDPAVFWDAEISEIAGSSKFTTTGSSWSKPVNSLYHQTSLETIRCRSRLL